MKKLRNIYNVLSALAIVGILEDNAVGMIAVRTQLVPKEGHATAFVVPGSEGGQHWLRGEYLPEALAPILDVEGRLALHAYNTAVWIADGELARNPGGIEHARSLQEVCRLRDAVAAHMLVGGHLTPGWTALMRAVGDMTAVVSQELIRAAIAEREHAALPWYRKFECCAVQ
ncbi:MAG: hypothetical protein LBS14_01800 [Holosporaceae bacterium]|jgi:hypothetical protein|nr:hypothetical protein [Holosporaceae bacterium]